MNPNWLPEFAIDLPSGVELWLPETAALAAVALIGYLFGKRTRRVDTGEQGARQQELDRASGIAHQLESIAETLRQDLASHHGRLTQFRRRLGEAQDSRDDHTWQLLCAEAEQMLSPTMQLAQQLSLAYDSIRQQSDALETFSQARTDPLTGVGNGRALAEKMDVLMMAAQRSGADFAVTLLSLDRDTNHATTPDVKKSRLRGFARLIQSCMRGSDYVARYGDDEFVVLLPHAKLAGACIFGERLRTAVAERMQSTVSCGVAEYQQGDDEKSLLGRADSAYYSAKAAGGSRQFVHTGSQIREQRPAAPPSAGPAPQPVAASAAAPLLDPAPVS